MTEHTRAQTRLVVGALSFEERCLAIVEAIRPGDYVDLVDYGRDATPDDLASRMREQHWSLIESLLSDSTSGVIRLTRVRINPYSASELCDYVVSRLSEFDEAVDLVLEISCFTRLHILALAIALTKLGRRRVTISYTLPASYQFDEKSNAVATGWKGTLLVALGDAPVLDHEGQSRGLVLLGYEADRLAVALEELETSGGTVVVSVSRDRPDIAAAVVKKNSSVLYRLRSVDLAVLKGSSYDVSQSGWRFVPVGLSDPKALLEIVAQEVGAAELAQAPMVLYPFGPKMSVLVAAYSLAMRYPGASWAVYPVALTHYVERAQGIGPTRTYELDEFSGDVAKREVTDLRSGSPVTA